MMEWYFYMYAVHKVGTQCTYIRARIVPRDQHVYGDVFGRADILIPVRKVCRY